MLGNPQIYMQFLNLACFGDGIRLESGEGAFGVDTCTVIACGGAMGITTHIIAATPADILVPAGTVANQPLRIANLAAIVS